MFVGFLPQLDRQFCEFSVVRERCPEGQHSAGHATGLSQAYTDCPADLSLPCLEADTPVGPFVCEKLHGQCQGHWSAVPRQKTVREHGDSSFPPVFPRT